MSLPLQLSGNRTSDNVSSHCPASLSCQLECTQVCFDEDLFRYVDICCDCGNICELTKVQKVLALVLLGLTLLLLAKQKWWFLPIGRAMGAGAMACVMVATQILSPAYALNQVGIVDVDTIATLFGLTVITGYLKEFGIIDASMRMLEKECSSPLLLLWRVMFLTTMLAALVTNDAAVIIITQPLIRSCEKMGTPVEPFLVALATTANIGSAIALTGNPQNVLVGNYSGISYFAFLVYMAPIVFAGLLMNFGFIWAFYYKSLHGFSKHQAGDGGTGAAVGPDSLGGVSPHRATRLTPLATRRAASGQSKQGKLAALKAKLRGIGRQGEITVRCRSPQHTPRLLPPTELWTIFRVPLAPVPVRC